MPFQVHLFERKLFSENYFPIFQYLNEGKLIDLQNEIFID